MSRTTLLHDFATLFAYNWHRDFPVDGFNRDMGSRSDWNIHTGITVRRVADLMGYFAHFESSNRTDSVIRDAQRNAVAFAEWEWKSPAKSAINEPKKLSDAAKKEAPQFCFLFSYTPRGTLQKSLDFVASQWSADTPLLVSLIEYSGTRRRTFHDMSLFQLRNGVWKCLRRQPALSWHLAGTRWELEESALEDAST
ncbi:MAG: hypothetical protein QM805_24290 [Pseudomonas sp.]